MMKHAKQTLAIFLVVMLMAAAFTGCGKMEEPEETPGTTSSASPNVSSSASPITSPIEETTSAEPEKTPETTSSAKPAGETPSARPEETPAATSGKPTSKNSNAHEVDADQLFGNIEGNKYTNEFFGFSISLPEGWYVTSREELAQIVASTTDYLSSEAEGATLDLDEQQILPLFLSASENPFSASGANPNIVCLAQNLNQYAGLLSNLDAKSFLGLNVKALEAQGIEAVGEVETLSLGGRELARVSAVQSANGMELHQTIYAFMKEGFAVVFTLSSFTDDEAQLLADTMNSISFK